jgi:hypothetical protein
MRTANARGQAATETMIVMMFLLLMIFGAIHMAMFAATKYMVDYAAFTAARTVLVQGAGATNGAAWDAAEEALGNIRWWLYQRNRPEAPIRRPVKGRDAIVIGYHVPFGLPIFESVPDEGILLLGFSPVVEQGEIPEKGDNASQ